jgi:hypothetical protein
LRDRAPDICRQRAIIEGIAPVKLTDVKIRAYLSRLAQVLDMLALTEPVTAPLAEVRGGGVGPLGDIRRAPLRMGRAGVVLQFGHLYM